MSETEKIALDAKSTSAVLATLSADKKNRILQNIAQALRSGSEAILKANQIDLEKGQANGLTQALLDRLALNEKRIEDMAIGVEQVSSLPDPIGEVISEWQNEIGLLIKKVRVPFGVVAMIYEARPNVTVDAATLCLKTGNAAVLRGSSSALNSNLALIQIIQSVLAKEGLPKECVQLIAEVGHEATSELMHLRGLVDVIVPRGSARLIKTVVENSTVPVIETGSGLCHVYVHTDAQYQMVEDIVINAKTQRPSVCNALETLLVQRQWAEKNLAKLCLVLEAKGVECRGCEICQKLVPEIKPATASDWETEYLDYILSIKVVDSVEEAVKHISRYGTKHSETIITESEEVAKLFMQSIDAAVVYQNASSRFTDGFIFGFGAEIGISTQKLHARGPMGLKEMTSYKYCVTGKGQIRK